MEHRTPAGPRMEKYGDAEVPVGHRNVERLDTDDNSRKAPHERRASASGEMLSFPKDFEVLALRS